MLTDRSDRPDQHDPADQSRRRSNETDVSPDHRVSEQAQHDQDRTDPNDSEAEPAARWRGEALDLFAGRLRRCIGHLATLDDEIGWFPSLHHCQTAVTPRH
jgi:hypothetical protein